MRRVARAAWGGGGGFHRHLGRVVRSAFGPLLADGRGEAL
jgi:hypothetical protein